MDRKKSAFIMLYAIAVLIASQINFSEILGAENQSFTFFQFIAPIAGGFLGLAGIAAVFFANLGGFLISGQSLTIFSFGIPSLFAVYYFYKNSQSKLSQNSIAIATVPLVCMALFALHPVGSQVWYYSFYWLIPAGAMLLFPGRLLARSLGSTFTAHAVGTIIFLYAIPTTPALWLALIPVVAFERGLFTLGIASSYIVANTILEWASTKLDLSTLNINKNYSISSTKLY